MVGPEVERRRSRLSTPEQLRTLHPGYFAFVMATAIVSVGVHDHDLVGVSTAMLWLAGGGYVILVVANSWRIVAFPADVRRDLADPARGFGFFTFVAGTNVLGARLVMADQTTAAVALLVVGGLAWLGLGYLLPWTAALGLPRRPVVSGANGAWFIWVVASQSVAVLAAALQPVVGAGARELTLLAVLCWSVGVVCYAIVAVLVVARLTFYPLRPVELTPPYWVAMGATAISVLAGSKILQMAEAPAATAAAGLAAGTSLVMWAFGTWLIPVLVAAGWWRHVTHRVPLRYEPTWWSIIFPLGMYGVAANHFGLTNALPLVAEIGRQEFWLALLAWSATGAAMLTHFWSGLRRRERRYQPGTVRRAERPAPRLAEDAGE